MKYHFTSTLVLGLASSALSAAEVPPSLVPTGAVVAARQIPPTVTVTGSLGDLINKADHDGHDDDSEQFRSGVGSFLTKATSVVGDAFKPDSTTTTSTGTGTNSPAAATSAGGQRNGAGQVSGRDGMSIWTGGVMAGLAGLFGAGVLLL